MWLLKMRTKRNILQLNDRNVARHSSFGQRRAKICHPKKSENN